MQAGRLRDRVTIQNFTTSRSPSGQPQKLWFDVATVRAEVKGISGREMMTADAERAESTIRVWMRYRSDITAASRILCLTGPFKGKFLDVSGPPISDSKGVRLEILCKQGVEP